MLISQYEAVLNRSTKAASKSTDHEPVKAMAELLEVIIIQRTSDSIWFGKIMIERLPHTCAEVSLDFSTNYRPAL